MLSVHNTRTPWQFVFALRVDADAAHWWVCGKSTHGEYDDGCDDDDGSPFLLLFITSVIQTLLVNM